MNYEYGKNYISKNFNKVDKFSNIEEFDLENLSHNYVILPHYLGRIVYIISHNKQIYIYDKKTFLNSNEYLKMINISYDDFIIEGKYYTNVKKYILFINLINYKDEVFTFTGKIDIFKKICQNLNSFKTDCIFTIPSYVPVNKLELLLNIIIPLNKIKINGIVFYSTTTKKHLIYINDKELKLYQNDKIINIDYTLLNKYFDFNLKIPEFLNINNILTNNIKKRVCIYKTHITDVYICYDIIDEINLENNIIEHNKIGLLCILDLKTSIKCYELFKSNGLYIINVAYNEKYNKWSPLFDAI